jgi:hypothetical protein
VIPDVTIGHSWATVTTVEERDYERNMTPSASPEDKAILVKTLSAFCPDSAVMDFGDSYQSFFLQCPPCFTAAAISLVLVGNRHRVKIIQHMSKA